MNSYYNGYGGSEREGNVNGGYEDYYDTFNVSTECRDFSKRKDISIFNMSDYRSCENCVHMSPDNRCMK